MWPRNIDQINRARGVPFSAELNFFGVYYECDSEYEALGPSRKNMRVQVGYQGRDFRSIFTGVKWLNELLPADHPKRIGKGASDFVRHLIGVGFVYAVKVCLDTAEESGSQ